MAKKVSRKSGAPAQRSTPLPPRTHAPLPKRFSMVRSFTAADLLTLGNGVCGSMSIMFAMRSLITQRVIFLHVGFAFVPLGVLFDFFDGKVARMYNSSSLLGQELDSLADLVSSLP
ncbi:CDP-diacylglycerol-serine O-phosphatidyltransferase [Smittium culicis]|uniref:CDP-diacylglycerol-serine O-phosphatidyltransferase n=1 Tax=Smittium culicis TaxID=133412 RepID=A0A1R1X304_9FUNG|nr:CDP-diacylglycerol-serine O-phosphatidyltransferase [Smittium culicis]